jgi:hypothetical protein
MQDFLVTIIIAWILFRLFRPVVFVQWNKPQKHYHNYYPGSQNQSGEGEIKAAKQSPQKKSDGSDGDGEYVDFEELPKS